MTTADQPAHPWHDVPPPETAAGAPVPVQGRRAGLVTRSSARVVDVLVVLLLLGVGWLGVAAARFLIQPAGFRFPVPPAGALLVLYLCLQAVYYAVTWAVVGGTYGDRLLGLRVVGERQERLHWGRSAVRAGLCTAFPLGLLWVLVSAQNRSVQDLLVRTSVVYDWAAS